MDVSTKYSIGQEVFYMEDNRVRKGIISTIEIRVAGTSDDQSKRVGRIEVKYGLYTGNLASGYTLFSDIKLFPTKEELLKSL